MRIVFLISLLCVLAGAESFKPVEQPEIEVVLKNIKSARGVFVISFYNDDKAFPKPGKDAFTERVTVHDTLQHTVKIKLPATGWYAVAMFQDEDGTGKIKQDKIGIPLEPYGFSNNVHPKTAAPSFSACKFFVRAGGNGPLVISLIHPRFVKEMQ